jgi:two-component sensor histidine kinase
MTKRDATTVDDLANDFTDRLQALSNVHTAVFEAGGEQVSLSAVVGVTLSPYNYGGVSHIDVRGEDMVVTREAGTTLALCLHELITNAIKYGALSRPEGKVNLSWEVEGTGDPSLFLRWVEAGGPPVRQPTRQGYGTRYVRSALGSLFGNIPVITFAPVGFQCSIGGPLSRLTPQKEPVLAGPWSAKDQGENTAS